MVEYSPCLRSTHEYLQSISCSVGNLMNYLKPDLHFYSYVVNCKNVGKTSRVYHSNSPFKVFILKDCLCSAGRPCVVSGIECLDCRVIWLVCKLLCERENNRWPNCRLDGDSVKRHRSRGGLNGRMNMIEGQGMGGLICARLICYHCCPSS